MIEALGGWLPLGMGAGGGPEAAPDEVRALGAEDVAPRSRASRWRRHHPSRPGRACASRGPTSSRRAGRRADGAQAEQQAGGARADLAEGGVPEPETTPAKLAAEMPASVVAKKAFQVRVRLSRKAIAATAGSAHAEADIEVDATRELSVQVDRQEERLDRRVRPGRLRPARPGGGTSELTFDVKATRRRAGHGERRRTPGHGAALDAHPRGHRGRQGRRPCRPDTTTTASAHPGIDAPELEGLPCLDIFERVLPDQSVVYQYAVRLEPGKPAALFESRPLKDRVARIAKILDDVAEVWRDGSADPHERERKLQDIGATMFDELFPEPMQAHLWKHRAKVHDLILYADEPFVPWELVHLKPPTGPRQTEAALPGPGRAGALAARQLPAEGDAGARGEGPVAVPGVPRSALRAHRAGARAGVPRGAVRCHAR